jgi:hypothetical protein
MRLNYYFVRAWGQRARAHFREKHLESAARFAAEQMQLPGGVADVAVVIRATGPLRGRHTGATTLRAQSGDDANAATSAISRQSNPGESKP